MGRTRSDYAAYATYATTSTTRSDGTYKALHEIFTKSCLDSNFDPKNIVVRESRDSEVNPQSRPVILGLDVSGSMGFMAEKIAKEKLGTLVTNLTDKKIINDPHIAIMAIGDAAASDTAPLQVTQFESDVSIAQQLQELFIEGRGGSNDSESYQLPWYFALNRVKSDAWEKRGVKGFIFTFGDECFPQNLSASQVKKVFGPSEQTQGIDSESLYKETIEQWEIFHVVIEQGNYARRNLNKVVKSWHKVLGNRVLCLSDFNYLEDVIFSAMKLANGEELEDVLSDLNDNVRNIVERALFKAEEICSNQT